MENLNCSLILNRTLCTLFCICDWNMSCIESANRCECQNKIVSSTKLSMLFIYGSFGIFLGIILSIALQYFIRDIKNRRLNNSENIHLLQ